MNAMFSGCAPEIFESEHDKYPGSAARMLYDMGDRHPAKSPQRAEFYRMAAECQRLSDEREAARMAAKSRRRAKRWEK